MTVLLSPEQTVHTGMLRVRRGEPVCVPYRIRFLGPAEHFPRAEQHRDDDQRQRDPFGMALPRRSRLAAEKLVDLGVRSCVGPQLLPVMIAGGGVGTVSGVGAAAASQPPPSAR